MQNKNLDYKHPNTVWEYIKEDLEVLIIKGLLKTGDKVPSINKLANHYNVSNSTAQKALETLFDKDILIKKQGIGYFVKPYTRNKLISEHKEKLKKRLETLLLESKELDIDKDELNLFINSVINKIYS